MANDPRQMHGFNLKTAAAMIKSCVVYKCRILNDESKTLAPAVVEVIVGHVATL